MALLPLSERYSQSFYDAFLKHCKQHENNVASLQECLPVVLDKLRRNATCEPFHVLGVGSGAGMVDISLLRVIVEHYSKESYPERTNIKIEIVNSIVEPSHHIDEFKKNVQSLPNSLNEKANIQFQFHQLPFETFLLGREESCSRCDIVHFIHSIYYVNLKETLLCCYHTILKEKGVIICIAEHKDSLLFKVRAILKESEGLGTERICTATRVVQFLKKQNWKFVHHTSGYDLDVTEIIRNSTEGDLLLDFLTLRNAFRTSNGREVVEKTLRLLEEISVQQEDGRRIARMANDFIMIFKDC